MSYLCPHCHKESYLSEAVEGLSGFSLICGHCDGHFITEPPEEALIDEGEICPLSCSKCDMVMHVATQDFDILADQIISCPACFAKLTLPTKSPPPRRLPARFTANLVTKLAIIYLLILASLALLFTHEGSTFIHQLASMSDTPQRALFSFRNLMQEFLSFIQGIFL